MGNGIVSRLLAPLVHRQTQERISFLMAVPIFRGLSPLQAGKLLNHCTERKYENGDIVFEEGEMGKALFLILDGAVKITKRTQDGDEIVLTTLTSGAYFGELALLDTLPRSASVTVIKPSTLLILYRSDFEALVSRNSDIGLPVMRVIAQTLSGQLRRMNEELAEALDED